MSPASLSTFAVINPGPTTAKKSRIRVFQRLMKLIGTFRRHRDETNQMQSTSQNKCPQRISTNKKHLGNFSVVRTGGKRRFSGQPTGPMPQSDATKRSRR